MAMGVLPTSSGNRTRRITSTSAEVAETLQPGFTAGASLGASNDWKCTLKNDDGTEESAQGDFGGQGRPTFTLDVDPQQIITCNIYNSFAGRSARDRSPEDGQSGAGPAAVSAIPTAR